MSSSTAAGGRADKGYVPDAFASSTQGAPAPTHIGSPSEVSPARAGAPGVVKSAPSVAKGWGRGPVTPDTRKYKYDVIRAIASQPVSFSVTKEDRMDASEAGALMHRLHQELGIDKVDERRIHGFNQALFFQHTINGASMLQRGQGRLVVDGHTFAYDVILRVLGGQARRFFRAYADDIAEVNRFVLQSVSSYDYDSVDKHGQLLQVAAERGLHKFPYLAHDSADACLTLSLEERRAVIASKRHVLMTGKNSVDMPFDVQDDIAIGRSQVT